MNMWKGKNEVEATTEKKQDEASASSCLILATAMSQCMSAMYSVCIYDVGLFTSERSHEAVFVQLTVLFT
jgi:hypothetical protein